VDSQIEMINVLPEGFRSELLFEVRKSLFLANPYWAYVADKFNKFFRTICAYTLVPSVNLSHEIVFSVGTYATKMILCESGSYLYVLGGHVEQEDATEETAGLESNAAKVVLRKNEIFMALYRGSIVTEQPLWVEKWAHTGVMQALTNSTTLDLPAETFIEVIETYADIFDVAAKYAKHYLLNLNNEAEPSDVYESPVDMDNLDAAVLDGSPDHLMFLSHFKCEAGSEATMLEEAFQKMIQADECNAANHMRRPIFLDTSDLEDLSTLRAEVAKSHNLVLLLTPNVLLRPWCLVEIVTAVRNNINIVPVTIVRPGLDFQFPDDAFYEALGKGTNLPSNAVQVLQAEGIELAEVVEAVHKIFIKIALLFSPHKATAIRQAEMDAILRRCIVRQL